MTSRIPVLGAIAVSFLASLVPACLSAQGREPVPPEIISPADDPAQGALMQEHKIDQFADALLAVEKVNVRTAAELRGTTDWKATERIKSNAESQIIQAVERTGLALDEFNRITELMMADLELRKKVSERVAQRRRT